MKKQLSTLLLLSCLILMLAMQVGIRQVHSENASPTFSDDFNGTSIDSTKWNVIQNIDTSGFPAYGGNVTVADSFVTLTSDGTSYPCITSAQDPFPTTGDFALEFDITYTRLETWGTGLWVSEGPFIPTNATNVAANILQVWSYFNGLTGVVSIGLLGKAVYTWNANLNPYGDQFSNPMLIRLEYAKGTYTLYLNGTVLASEESTLRADTIGFGLPPVITAPFSSPGPWDTFKIDSIEVLPASDLTIQSNLLQVNAGFSVNLDGNLSDTEGNPLAGATIVISTQPSGVSTWNILTTTSTDENGAYAVTWIPQVTGNFLLKAQWTGNSEYAGTFDCKNVSITQGDNAVVFLAESNSTLSSLFFNSTANEIRFTASGPPGTTGYVRFEVSKTLLGNLTQFQVYLDGQQLQFNLTSEGDMQVLYFQYHHSSHDVLIKILPSEAQVPEIPSFSVLIMVGIIALITALAVGVTAKKRKSLYDSVELKQK